MSGFQNLRSGLSDSKWKPLLNGDLRGRAFEAIDAIAKSLEKRAVANASLAGGTAGLAVFYSVFTLLALGRPRFEFPLPPQSKFFLVALSVPGVNSA